MSTVQITKNWHPEPKTILVESTPVQEGTKLSIIENQTTSSPNPDLIGLSWILNNEWSDLD